MEYFSSVVQSAKCVNIICLAILLKLTLLSVSDGLPCLFSCNIIRDS